MAAAAAATQLLSLPLLLLLVFSFPPTTISTPIPSLPSSPLEWAPSSSTISAAPAYLPDTPKLPAQPPAPSPDITPLFPSPSRGGKSSPSGTIPTIPSSPSPPNPDLIGPNSVSAPLGSSSSSSPAATNFTPVTGFLLPVVFGLVVMWWL